MNIIYTDKSWLPGTRGYSQFC